MARISGKAAIRYFIRELIGKLHNSRGVRQQFKHVDNNTPDSNAHPFSNSFLPHHASGANHVVT